MPWRRAASDDEGRQVVARPRSRAGPRRRSPRSAAARLSGPRGRGAPRAGKPRRSRALRVAGPRSRSSGEVLGRVDVEADPGQLEHARREPGGPRGLQVIVEGGLAELERHRVGRRQERGVGARSRRATARRPRRGPPRGRSHSAAISSAVTHGTSPGMVRKRARAAGERLPLGEGDRLGVAAVGALGEAARRRGAGREPAPPGRAVTTSTAPGRAPPRRRARPRAWRGELAALGRRERGDEALLGVDEILDGHRDEAGSCESPRGRGGRARSPPRGSTSWCRRGDGRDAERPRSSAASARSCSSMTRRSSQGA